MSLLFSIGIGDALRVAAEVLFPILLLYAIANNLSLSIWNSLEDALQMDEAFIRLNFEGTPTLGLVKI